MALATVLWYDPDRISGENGRAVVVGAGIAGLCTARILVDEFEEVTVVDRDPLPDDPIARREMPQASHIHVLQEAGRSTLTDLFPEFEEKLLSAGGLVIDGTRDAKMYNEGGVQC